MPGAAGSSVSNRAVRPVRWTSATTKSGSSSRRAPTWCLMVWAPMTVTVPSALEAEDGGDVRPGEHVDLVAARVGRHALRHEHRHAPRGPLLVRKPVQRTFI